MLDEILEVLRRVGVWIISIALGGFVLLKVLRALLPALANTATAFIATPGGLLLVVVAWWRLNRKRHGR